MVRSDWPTWSGGTWHAIEKFRKKNASSPNRRYRALLSSLTQPSSVVAWALIPRLREEYPCLGKWGVRTPPCLLFICVLFCSFTRPHHHHPPASFVVASMVAFVVSYCISLLLFCYHHQRCILFFWHLGHPCHCCCVVFLSPWLYLFILCQERIAIVVVSVLYFGVRCILLLFFSIANLLLFFVELFLWPLFPPLYWATITIVVVVLCFFLCLHSLLVFWVCCFLCVLYFDNFLPLYEVKRLQYTGLWSVIIFSQFVIFKDSILNFYFFFSLRNWCYVMQPLYTIKRLKMSLKLKMWYFQFQLGCAKIVGP